MRNRHHQCKMSIRILIGHFVGNYEIHFMEKSLFGFSFTVNQIFFNKSIFSMTGAGQYFLIYSISLASKAFRILSQIILQISFSLKEPNEIRSGFFK